MDVHLAIVEKRRDRLGQAAGVNGQREMLWVQSADQSR